MARSTPSFGRRANAFALGAEQQAAASMGSDLRLFALTFAGGFLFMSVFLA